MVAPNGLVGINLTFLAFGAICYLPLSGTATPAFLLMLFCQFSLDRSCELNILLLQNMIYYNSYFARPWRWTLPL